MWFRGIVIVWHVSEPRSYPYGETKTQHKMTLGPRKFSTALCNAWPSLVWGEKTRASFLRSSQHHGETEVAAEPSQFNLAIASAAPLASLGQEACPGI